MKRFIVTERKHTKAKMHFNTCARALMNSFKFKLKWTKQRFDGRYRNVIHDMNAPISRVMLLYWTICEYYTHTLQDKWKYSSTTHLSSVGTFVLLCTNISNNIHDECFIYMYIIFYACLYVIHFYKYTCTDNYTCHINPCSSPVV